VVVATGAYAELSQRELDGLNVREVFNPRWQTGMASSIRVGLNTLLAADTNASAAVFLLCDQPHITPDIISRLTEAHRVAHSPIIASTYGDSFGVPALFSRMCFAELARLECGAGAKHLIARHASDAHFTPFPGGEVDLDTPEDLSHLIACDRSEGEPVRPVQSRNCSRNGSKGRRNEKARPTEVVSNLRVAPPGLDPGLS
jgi:molybdenum cofactor cytidylyltransferase